MASMGKRVLERLFFEKKMSITLKQNKTLCSAYHSKEFWVLMSMIKINISNTGLLHILWFINAKSTIYFWNDEKYKRRGKKLRWAMSHFVLGETQNRSHEVKLRLCAIRLISKMHEKHCYKDRLYNIALLLNQTCRKTTCQ